jgi:UDP-N-acetylmuramoyl-tripeptide--D-alanyl-D-alanine ligase
MTMTTHDPLWTKDDIAKAIKGRWLAPPDGDINITGVCYFMGQIVPGDLVFALSHKTWGNKYPETIDRLEEMQRKGAQAVIVDQIPKVIPPGLAVYLNESTEFALNQLGAAARQRFQGKVICVTGSVGKSSTKRGIATVLGQQGLTGESRKNFNHFPGLPLSLSQTPANFDYGVYEFAVDGPQYTLAKALTAQPHVAVVTEIQHDHHHYYPTLEAIVDQKSLLFRALTPDGVAVLNRDTPYYTRLHTAALNNHVSRIISFGEHRRADVRLIDCKCAIDFSEVTASVFGHIIHYQLAIPGRHNVRNSLAILAAVCAVGADYEKAGADLHNMASLPNHCIRSKIAYQQGEFELLDDTFSANPASIKAAFEYFQLFQPQAGGRKIIILGDIKELGASSAALHAGLADPFLRTNIDKIFAIGPFMKNLCDALPPERVGFHTEDAEALIETVRGSIKPGDVVMVKGSCHSSDVLNRIVKSLQQL